MSKQPLSSVDTAWLRMEDPANMMMITGVLVLSAPVDFERLKATLEHRFLCHERFRQRVVQPRLGAPYWKDDPDFDLDYHLQRITLPPPGDQAALQEVVSELMSTQLDFTKPLWQMHLAENYGDGCALIGRLHHCIADGIALMHVLLSMGDTDPHAPWPTAQPKKERRRGWDLLGPIFKTTAQVTGTLLHEGLETLVKPSHALDLARMGTDSAAALGRLVLRWPDPKTLFKGKLGVPKRAAWSEPLPLTDVKAIGRATGCTVNDVLLAAVTGALRHYMQGRGEPVDDVRFRAVVPVNLRPPGVVPDLGNKFSLVFLTLPIDIADPLDRVREIKQYMDGLKGSPEPAVAFGILNTIGMAPSEIQDIVVNIFGTKGTGVMTNVPGPKEKLYLAGAPLDSIIFWVPQSGHLGLGVSIMSYAGQVWVGFATDQGLVPDPETIVANFHAEFDKLLELARSAKPAPTVKAMLAMLDKTIESLEQAPAATATPEGASAHCQAKTHAGQPCKRPPLPGSHFCSVHQKRKKKAGAPSTRRPSRKNVAKSG